MTDPATTQTAIRPQWFSEQVLAAQAAYERTSQYEEASK